MYDIIPLVEIDHEPRVDSRLIAEQLGIQHQNFRELIQDHQADFEEFGQLRFETGVTNGHQGGGNPSKFVLLNEDQSYLGVKNTPQSRELKKRLVRTFGECRRRPIPAAFPVVNQEERPTPALLSPQTVEAMQHLKEVLGITEEFAPPEPVGRPSALDCVALLNAIIEDLLQWRYPYPFAYGFDITGRAYVVFRLSDAVYHLRKATHFKDFFECMSSKAEWRIEQELAGSGLLFQAKRGPVIDGVRMKHGLFFRDLRDQRQRLAALQKPTDRLS